MKALLILFTALLVPARLPAAEPVDYLRDVKPILAQNCYACHGPDKQRAGLRLDTAAAALHGGNSGPALVPGSSADSLLVKAVTGAGDVKVMPPKEPRLPAAQIAVLRAWIDGGAKAPPSEIAAAAARSKHWAFQKPVRPAEPAVQDAAWVRNPIDRFILARLEKEGLKPSPEADRLTLLRRVSLDLLGLPPSPEEVEAFLNDSRPDAYERLVERLLASPHYGERWGRHWLDLARYADSNGYSIDAPRSIWKYRDWVIDALNRDLPFDQFTLEQLAGDLLPGATLEQRIATGFHRNTSINEEGGINVEQFRIESIIDRVNTTGSVFLGLTVGCAQCHDHKFDPLSQREYYQLFAFLNNVDEPKLELATPEELRRRQQIRARVAALERRRKSFGTYSAAAQDRWEQRLTPADRRRLPPAIQAILEIPENGRIESQKQTLAAYYRQLDLVRHVAGGLGDPLPFLAAGHAAAAEFRTSVEKQIADLKKAEPQVVSTMVVQERKQPRTTYVMLGGDFLRRGATVSPGAPAVLHPLPAVEKPTRLDLARWLVSPDNPLTARVTVNRLWQNYFGIGLVETENDFGTQGTPPSHPQLLDWLATEFQARRWSLKAMHGLIVTSATYRQASRHRPELATVDARNRLLARQSRVRLDAEVVRDVALAASGLLTRKVGGPSVHPPQPEGIYRFTQVPRDWKADTGPDRYRRGLYTYFWRSAPHPGLIVFDAPDATSACTRRNRSNTPLQALTLLNDQAFFEFARALAARVLREAPADETARIRQAFRLCLARPPSAAEERRLAELLAEQGEMTPLAAWTTVARVLLNLDEFITRE
jgi:mono/diheme cytochrome c family protein